jgi:hypothetical protein
MTFTAEETAIEFPLWCTVVFRGYSEKKVRGWLRVGQTLTVVGHTVFPGPVGIIVVSARGDGHFVFATEVVHACKACDGPAERGFWYCGICIGYVCDLCGDLDLSCAETEDYKTLCDYCVERTGAERLVD